MSKTAKILVAAAILASTATSAFAQGYYYYGQVPAEQRHWYDRNAIGQNV
jgi:hypothetical protein